MTRPRRPLPGNARAIGYARVSTDKQADSGLGLEAQRAAIEQTAARLGLPLATIYTDAGISGSADVADRPALADALNALRRGDVLLVMKRDRVARDTLLAIVVERAVQKKGARIVSAAGEGTEADPTDPTAMMMRRISDAFHEYERLMIGLRTRAALKAKRARGELAGNRPYGFAPNGDGKTLHPHEPEQAILRVIAECRAAGYSLQDTADELNRRGLRTRTGSPWRRQYVYSIAATCDRHAPVTG